MHGIIVKDKVLRLVRTKDLRPNLTCFKCALEMDKCDTLCMRFGRMLGYTRKDTEDMYFKEI